jgi:hypothetical protein
MGQSRQGVWREGGLNRDGGFGSIASVYVVHDESAQHQTAVRIEIDIAGAAMRQSAPQAIRLL